MWLLSVCLPSCRRWHVDSAAYEPADSLRSLSAVCCLQPIFISAMPNRNKAAKLVGERNEKDENKNKTKYVGFQLPRRFGWHAWASVQRAQNRQRNVRQTSSQAAKRPECQQSICAGADPIIYVRLNFHIFEVCLKCTGMYVFHLFGFGLLVHNNHRGRCSTNLRELSYIYIVCSQAKLLLWVSHHPDEHKESMKAFGALCAVVSVNHPQQMQIFIAKLSFILAGVLNVI